MRKFLQTTLLVAFNVALTIVLVELLFIGYYWSRDGKYISAHDRLAAERSSFDIGKSPKSKPCNRHGPVLAPHPYLAFVRASRPDCKRLTNNTGHRGPDIPLEKSENEYRVMILGGSVARQVYKYELDTIRDYFQDRHPDKTVRIYNGAIEAWKQPQQLFMLQFYGEVVDAAISIEGYNEIRFNSKFDYMLRFETPFTRSYRKANAQFLNQDEKTAMYLNRKIFDFTLDNPVTRRSNTAYFISESVRKQLEISATSLTKSAEESINSEFAGAEHLRTVFLLPEEWDRQQRRDYHLRAYQKYLGLMQATAKYFGISYAVFIQPTPLLHKPLSKEEKEVVTITTYADDYKLYEQYLLEKQEELQVYSLSGVFDSVEETIYMDSIHFHKESSGGRRIVEAIFEVLDQRW